METIKGTYTRLLFECVVCKKIFKEPGICPECEMILKVRGE